MSSETNFSFGDGTKAQIGLAAYNNSRSAVNMQRLLSHIPNSPTSSAALTVFHSSIPYAWIILYLEEWNFKMCQNSNFYVYNNFSD